MSDIFEQKTVISIYESTFFICF